MNTEFTRDYQQNIMLFIQIGIFIKKNPQKSSAGTIHSSICNYSENSLPEGSFEEYSEGTIIISFEWKKVMEPFVLFCVAAISSTSPCQFSTALS